MAWMGADTSPNTWKDPGKEGGSDGREERERKREVFFHTSFAKKMMVAGNGHESY